MKHIDEALQVFYETDRGPMLPKKRRARAYNDILNLIRIFGSSEGNGTGALDITLEEHNKIISELRHLGLLSADKLITAIAACTTHATKNIKQALLLPDMKKYLAEAVKHKRDR